MARPMRSRKCALDSAPGRLSQVGSSSNFALIVAVRHAVWQRFAFGSTLPSFIGSLISCRSSMTIISCPVSRAMARPVLYARCSGLA